MTIKSCKRLVIGAVLLSCATLQISHAQVAQLTEVNAQIDAFWKKKMSHCGGADWYIGYDGGQIQHLRSARWSIQARQLTDAEIRNGLQWRGVTVLEAAQTRFYMPRAGGWKAWEQGIGFGAYGVEVTKNHGQWTLSPSQYGAVDQMFALPCDRVPKDPTAQELQQAQTARQSQFCANAINPGNAVGTVQAFLDAGGDPNACKDSDGRNLLMILPMQERWMWEGEAQALVRSGRIDLNAKDRFGYPALYYMLIRIRIVNKQSPSYVQGYSQVADAMINRGADKKPWFTPDGSRVDWDKIPYEFPRR